MCPIDIHIMRSNVIKKVLHGKLNRKKYNIYIVHKRPRDFKRMPLRTYVISTMRFDGHLSDGYPSI